MYAGSIHACVCVCVCVCVCARARVFESGARVQISGLEFRGPAAITVCHGNDVKVPGNDQQTLTSQPPLLN